MGNPEAGLVTVDKLVAVSEDTADLDAVNVPLALPVVVIALLIEETVELLVPVALVDAVRVDVADTDST